MYKCFQILLNLFSYLFPTYPLWNKKEYYNFFQMKRNIIFKMIEWNIESEFMVNI